jgi:hypothetical protein
MNCQRLLLPFTAEQNQQGGVMPGFDVMNGMASVGPIGFLIGVGLIYLISKLLNK